MLKIQPNRKLFFSSRFFQDPIQNIPLVQSANKPTKIITSISSRMNIAKKYRQVLTIFLSSSFVDFLNPCGMVVLKKPMKRLLNLLKGKEQTLKKKAANNSILMTFYNKRILIPILQGFLNICKMTNRKKKQSKKL